MRAACTLFALVVTGASACYDSDAGRPREAVEDEAAFEQALAEVDWMQAQACCQEAGARGVESTLRAAILRGMAEDRPSPDSGARYDAQAAAACLDELAAPALCWQLKTPFPRANDSPCARVYQRGNRQLGEVCRSFWDCAEHARGEATCGFGSVAPDGIIDVCKLQFLAEEGEPCADDDPETEVYCQWPLLCDPSERCVARAERGERCITGFNWGDTCALGSVCDRLDTERCVEPIGVGEACSDDELCEGSACVEETCRPANDYSGFCEW
jgi:hypothetical protein